MATQSPPPDAPASEQAPQAPAAPPSTAGVYEYVDLTPLTYQFPGAPLTPRFGDVCDLPYDPADGRWKPSKAKVTRRADNDPEQAEKNAAEQSAARAKVHQQAAEQDAAASGRA